jgi:3-methyladenine DNA glycosylase/8-oxoguanine DNA glycosylase
MPLSTASLRDMTSFAAQLRSAEHHLSDSALALKSLIQQVGPCRLSKERKFEPFHSLMRSICHQQLSGKAAETILGRVNQRFGEGDFPSPEAIGKASVEALRACGLSNAKALAMKDLAEKVLDLTVPTAAQLHRMSDEAIVEALTQVRGVGRWTVEMTLMFKLGRLDVLPVADLGVRKGFTRVFKEKALVPPKKLEQRAEPFRPYRTVFSWYLWRATELP